METTSDASRTEKTAPRRSPLRMDLPATTELPPRALDAVAGTVLGSMPIAANTNSATLPNLYTVVYR